MKYTFGSKQRDAEACGLEYQKKRPSHMNVQWFDFLKDLLLDNHVFKSPFWYHDKGWVGPTEVRAMLELYFSQAMRPRVCAHKGFIGRKVGNGPN